MKRFPVLLISLLFALDLAAQDKIINLSDLFTSRDLFPVSISGLQWLPGSDGYTYIEDTVLMTAKARNDRSKAILTLSGLNAALNSAGIKELGRFPGYTWKDANTLRIERPGKVIEYKLKEKTASLASETDPEAEGVEYAPVTGYAAYTRGPNLYVSVAGKEIALSDEEEGAGIVFGQSVSRNEFAISDGIFWSPDGTMLAFYRKDESKVTEYPLVDIDHRVAQVKNIRYPMAGMESETITVGVYNTLTGQTTYLESGGQPNEYLTNVTWSPDSRHIFLAELNRGQDSLELNMYASGGKFEKTLLAERNAKYVEPEHGPIFDPYLPGDQFIWYSERDGYDHLYLYSLDGTMIRQLTSGPWIVTGFLGFDASGKWFYIMSTKESPLERHLYKVNFADGLMEKITPVHGTHNILMSPDRSMAIDRYSSTETAGEYLMLNTGNGSSRVIRENVDPLADYAMGRTTIFPILAEDSTELYCRMILPPGFDPGKKYPVFYYLYGGPHTQLVTDSWLGGAGFFLNYMAEKGYIVFTLDNRGSEGRGFEFESVIHRHVGELEAKDQHEGIEWLKQQQWVDTSRIGIQGWSYGGFMTINMILTYPGDFRVAVAGGPVIDWKWYEVMYGERYMDTPGENPEGYKASSLLERVGQLDSRLLIIHGSMDPTVVQQHSLAFVEACVGAGKQLDYFVYPGHEHNIGGPDRVHLWMKIAQYIDDQLER